MLVTENNFFDVCAKISREEFISLDTETTGLFPYLGDRLFGIAVGLPDATTYYFNFSSSYDHWGVKPSASVTHDRERIQQIFSGFRGTAFLHNAKFDLHFLAQERSFISGSIHCTLAVARIENNDRLSYSLDTLGKEIGFEKDDKVKKFLDEHKLFEYKIASGRKKKVKKYDFTKVPLDIMSEYAQKDAFVTFKLGMHQLDSIEKQNKKFKDRKDGKSLWKIYEQETKLTRVFFEMERRGIKLDKEYVNRFIPHEEKQSRLATGEFESITGFEFKDSGKVFADAFASAGESFPLTEKGNPSFNNKALDSMTSPAAAAIKKYRKSKSRINYLNSFLEFCDPDDFIHATIKQSGTSSGRVSYADPPLQCVEKAEKSKDAFLVRRAFVPPSPDHHMVMMDYDQMEYRVMLDYAREMDVVEQVLGGVDIHTATAEKMKVDRTTAKTLNFMLLYGGGVAKLAISLYAPRLTEWNLKEMYTRMWRGETFERISEDLKVPLVDVKHDAEELEKAFETREQYFRNMPKVKEFITKVKQRAQSRGMILTWLGRKLRYTERNYYAAPNGLIQGGCADIVKQSMLKIDDILKDSKSYIMLQVHDELLFAVHKTELDFVPKLKGIMEATYPYKVLPLSVGVDWSLKNWQDKEEFSLSLT